MSRCVLVRDAGGPRRRRWAEIVWATGCLSGLAVGLWLSACGREQPPAKAPGSSSAAATTDQGGAPTAAVGIPSGWALTVSGGGGSQARRHAAVASFTLRDGQSLDPLVPAQGMTAAFQGVIEVPERGRYRFGVEAQGGTVKLAAFDAGGKPVGEANSTGAGGVAWTPWMDLSTGPVSMNIQFARSAGAARLRTLWERQGVVDQGGFPPEPIPVAVVSPPRHLHREVLAAESAWRGRVLMGELNCTGCHRAGGSSEVVLTARTAPLLGEIGRRADPEWLLRWVADPQAVKPGCDMPDVIGDTPADLADAEAITHFLVSLGGPADTQAAATESHVLDLGRRLYHTVGCVACHGPMEPSARVFADEAQPTALPDAKPPVPFGNLSGKWRPGPLSEFLKDPLRTHPAGRMPSLKLDAGEADAIATYLVNYWGSGERSGNAFVLDEAKAEAGRAAFAARGCASCHQLGGNRPAVPSTLKARPLAELSAGAGCLAADHAASPRYTLSDQDRADLAAAMDIVKKVAALEDPPAAPIDEGERLVAAFGCTACHIKDGHGGPDDGLKPYFRTVDETELGDEGRLPPRLTGVGGKLNPSWLRTVLTDAGVARPYMATRMPQYGKLNVGRLHALLIAADGARLEAEDPSEPKATDDLVLAGRRLVGENGMNCISCHTYQGRAAGTPGPDITGFAERLRYDWWKSYVLAPARYKPGTRMTAFYGSGRGSIHDVFEGDPDRQTDALWAYFTTTGFGGPAPEGVPSDKGLPVPIGDRPSIFRTFLKTGGSRGIAVGYPIGIHFGFDANTVRLVDAWQGDFIDATSAWKGRGGQIAGGQGKFVWRAPAGPPLVIGARPESWPKATGRDAGYRFKGYRLESDGTPTFMYALETPAGDVRVEERFTPRPRSGALIAREFTLSGVPGDALVWMNPGPGQCVIRAATGAASEEPGPDGARWFKITPEGGRAVFVVEITP